MFFIIFAKFLEKMEALQVCEITNVLVVSIVFALYGFRFMIEGKNISFFNEDKYFYLILATLGTKLQ